MACHRPRMHRRRWLCTTEWRGTLELDRWQCLATSLHSSSQPLATARAVVVVAAAVVRVLVEGGSRRGRWIG